MTQVLDFLWGSIQYEDVASWGLIQRDLWGPLWPGKISGHGLSQYSFQGTIYAKSAMTQVLVISGGFSENRFFGTYQILWMSDLGGLTLVPYGLPGPNADFAYIVPWNEYCDRPWPLIFPGRRGPHRSLWISPKNAKSSYWIDPHKKSRTCVIAVFGYIVPLDRVYQRPLSPGSARP